MTVLKGWKYALASIGILIVCGLLLAITTEAKPADENLAITKKIAYRQYGKPIKIFNGNITSVAKARKLILQRKGKPYVLVEKNTSVSRGIYGVIQGKWITRYNKYVQPGKRVISYYIYNPGSNYIDDVSFVIDNGKWR